MMNLRFVRPAGETLQVLCLGAHSDDIEIGCGGTILTLLQEYERVAVTWIVFSGNATRAAEARVSATAFLTAAKDHRIELKDYPDGFFPFRGDEIKGEFEAIKSEFSVRCCQPDVIFTHYRSDRHQDHRMISDLTWNTFRNHLVLEYEIPKYDGDLGSPNLFCPLTEQNCQHKIHLLTSSFESQRGKQWFDDETFRAILRLRGMEANSSTRYAEAFYCRKLVLG